MCGASREQKDMFSKQSAFYDTMTKSYQAVFGASQAILSKLTSVFQPIFEKGPDQEGFGPEQKAALQTVTNENVAGNYKAATEALEEGIAGRQGSEVVPSGADEGQRRRLAASAAATKSGLENANTIANYETGRQNFQMAAQGLEEVSAQDNPVGFSGAATGAGSAASKTATDIASASNSIWGSVLGAIGGIAGGAIGAGGILNKPPAPAAPAGASG